MCGCRELPPDKMRDFCLALFKELDFLQRERIAYREVRFGQRGVRVHLGVTRRRVGEPAASARAHLDYHYIASTEDTAGLARYIVAKVRWDLEKGRWSI